MRKTTTYSPEVRERAVRMVLEHLNDYPSEWAAIEAIAPKIGCAAQTLHGWIRRQQTDAGHPFRFKFTLQCRVARLGHVKHPAMSFNSSTHWGNLPLGSAKHFHGYVQQAVDPFAADAVWLAING